MTDRHQVRLGAVQETLFIPLTARARESLRKKPVLRDPKAAEMVRSIDYDAAKYGRGAGGWVTAMRTAIFDSWARAFLTEHPGGTVVEIGSGLTTVSTGWPPSGTSRPGGPGRAMTRARWSDSACGCWSPRLSPGRPRRCDASCRPRYRYLLPLANPLLGKTMSITLFQAGHVPANPLAPA